MLVVGHVLTGEGLICHFAKATGSDLLRC